MCCSLIAILVFQPCHRLNHRHTPDAFRTCLNFAQNEESTVTNTVPASCQIQPDPKGFLSITKEKCDPMTPFKRSLVVPAITHYRCHPMNGVRVGEACNPGPHCQPPNPTDSPVHQVTCVVTNPTSVYRKTPELVDLAADLLILSETSATQAVQAIEGQALRTKGYHSAWGHPVPPQLSSASDDSLRGAAAGVSVHSRYMCRNSHHPDHSDWFYSGRCQTVFVQFPTIEVKVCNMYGFPASTAFAKGRTNSLFEHVIQTSPTTHATMICGDFNHHPDQLDAMQILRSLGFRTVEELHFDLTGQTLPHTFGTSTKNDVCILSPTLASLVTHVWVDDSKRFAGHNPLVFQLQLPGHEICTRHTGKFRLHGSTSAPIGILSQIFINQFMTTMAMPMSHCQTQTLCRFGQAELNPQCIQPLKSSMHSCQTNNHATACQESIGDDANHELFPNSHFPNPLSLHGLRITHHSPTNPV